MQEVVPPRRIGPLLPNATEIVFALGLGDQLMAGPHECDYPAEASQAVDGSSYFNRPPPPDRGRFGDPG